MPTIALSSANPSPQAQLPLAAALRAGTAELHGEAERAGTMRDLLRGRVARSGYCALLRNLHAGAALLLALRAAITGAP
jgi:heme oxygenase